MAELTLHSWDKEFDTYGAATILRDECGLHIKDAKSIIDLVKRGTARTIQVPFAKKEKVRKALEVRGFRTS